MAIRKAIVLVNGEFQQLQAGDTLGGPVAEVDLLSLTNGESGAITIGQAVYLDASNDVKKAKADASGTARVFGFVATASISASSSGNIQTDGILSGFTSLTPGSKYYLSAATAGAITATAPTTTGQLVTAVGIAVNATDLEIRIEDPILL